MTLAYHIVTTTIRSLADVICRVDDAQLDRVPDRGPLIIVGNHVNFMEAPVLFTHLQPRLVTGFAKAENWDNPLTRTLANLWRGIPLRRGEADVSAIRQALAALEAGHILGVAPEGTRSGHGRLQRGRPGVTLLALRTSAAVLPLVCYGHEIVWRNLAHLRRTDFHIVVGQPFHLVPNGRKATHLVRQQMVDEVMYQMAALLPAQYRGVYADLSAATETYLRFPAGAASNLNLAQG
jgi:1-acyl-sn-glycerol-3-phosphate acyltransferase